MLRVLEVGLQQLRLTAFVGRYRAAEGAVRVFPLSEGARQGEPLAERIRETQLDAAPVLARAIREHASVWVPDPAAQLGGFLPMAGATDEEEARALRELGRAVVVPMVAHGRASGVLVVLGESLEADEAPPIRELADHLAIALDNADVVSELKAALLREHAAARELRRLEALVGELAAEGAPEVVSQRVTQAAAEALGLGRVALYVWDEEAGQLALGSSIGVDAELASALSGVGAESRLGQALRGGASVVIPDLRVEADWSPFLAASEAAGLRSSWFVPLISREGERLGALAFLAERVSSPTDEQLDLAQRYAQHAAVALAGVRRREREVRALRVEVLAELARSIPHELNQPLAIIAGYAELIAENLVRGRQLREACREIVTAANALAELVQRLERITSYATKEYGPGRTVIDFERSAEAESGPE